MRHSKNTFKYSLLLIVGFGVGVLGMITRTLGWAHGGDDTLIHACVVPSSGTIRIIGSLDSCRPGQVPLDWSIGGDGELENHHQHLEFNLIVGQSVTFPLPITEHPVRIDVSGTGLAETNGVVAEPAVASTIVVFDSTADPSVSNTRNPGLSGPTNANNFGCGGEMNIVANQDHTVTLTTSSPSNSCSQTIPANFSVSMWY